MLFGILRFVDAEAFLEACADNIAKADLYHV
jgi:hypothetical protein